MIRLRRRAHTDYVNHMIRFYFTTPDSLEVAGHTTAEVKNWLSVQAVMAGIDEKSRALIKYLYTGTKQYDIAVRDFAKENGIPADSAWAMYNRVITAIAKERGLI